MTAVPAHLVGSIMLPDAETTFRIVSEHLGGHLPRIPDGEVGERFYWIQFQRARFDRTPGLSRVGDTPFYIRDQFDGRPFQLDAGVDADTLHFPPLGYADAALDSYATFAALRAEGVIREGTRFQVSLPTPAGVVGSFFMPESRAAVEPAYERALFAELDHIVAGIPAADLAIQWDTALEFGMLEAAEIRGYRITSWFGDTFDEILRGVIDRAARQTAAVPDGVELGYHLCYGDVEEEHFVQPKDAGTLAAVLAGILDSASRTVDWVHLPVPIERDDTEFFAPLSSVAVPAATELFLGLIHHEDGADGAIRRATAARTAVPEFGIATECGFGRGPRERTEMLLDLHAEVSDALA